MNKEDKEQFDLVFFMFAYVTNPIVILLGIWMYISSNYTIELIKNDLYFIIFSLYTLIFVTYIYLDLKDRVINLIWRKNE